MSIGKMYNSWFNKEFISKPVDNPPPTPPEPSADSIREAELTRELQLHGGAVSTGVSAGQLGYVPFRISMDTNSVISEAKMTDEDLKKDLDEYVDTLQLDSDTADFKKGMLLELFKKLRDKPYVSRFDGYLDALYSNLGLGAAIGGSIGGRVITEPISYNIPIPITYRDED